MHIHAWVNGLCMYVYIVDVRSLMVARLFSLFLFESAQNRQVGGFSAVTVCLSCEGVGRQACLHYQLCNYVQGRPDLIFRALIVLDHRRGVNKNLRQAYFRLSI